MTTFSEIFDRETSIEGKPNYIGVNANGDDAVLYIAEMENKNHLAAVRKYSEAMARSRHNKKKYQLIICKIIAESILIGWIGIIDKDGKKVEDTIENRVDALNKHSKLLESVVEFASEPSNFADNEDMTKEEVAEDTEGN